MSDSEEVSDGLIDDSSNENSVESYSSSDDGTTVKIQFDDDIEDSYESVTEESEEEEIKPEPKSKPKVKRSNSLVKLIPNAKITTDEDEGNLNREFEKLDQDSIALTEEFLFPRAPDESDNNYNARILLQSILKTKGLSPLASSVCSSIILRKAIYNVSYEEPIEKMVENIMRALEKEI